MVTHILFQVVTRLLNRHFDHIELLVRMFTSKENLKKVKPNRQNIYIDTHNRHLSPFLYDHCSFASVRTGKNAKISITQVLFERISIPQEHYLHLCLTHIKCKLTIHVTAFFAFKEDSK